MGAPPPGTTALSDAGTLAGTAWVARSWKPWYVVAVTRGEAMAVDSAAAARWLASRNEQRRERLRGLLQAAQRAAARIISAIAEQYQPRRIYQWGSLLHTERFREISDIDIAIEGLECDERVLASYGRKQS